MTTAIQDQAIVEIERLGFDYSIVAEFDITRLDETRRVQMRDANHYAPKDTVERFAIQMGEVVFPPIVVTSDDWIIDGNTRVGARYRRKEKFTPALVLNAKWGGASQKTRNTLYALALTLNAQNGMPPTAAEIRRGAEHLIALGWKTEQIGRAIGLRPSGVVQVKRAIDAANKLKKVGMNPNGDLKGASLRALGAREVLALNDVPFRELAVLAADAGLNASEINQTAKLAKETGSDSDALAYIAGQRTEFSDRIRERELTGVGRPPVSRMLRQRLGFVTKYVGREQELLETDPNVSATHIAALDTAIAVLTEVRRMQEG